MICRRRFQPIYGNMDCTELKQFAEQHLSSARFEHTLGTAELCAALGRRFSADETSCVIAGLGHDLLREWSPECLKKYLHMHPVRLSPVENRNPVLLHAPASAQYLKEELNIPNEEVWKAVRWHTTGHREMGKLGCILFTADFTEPKRSHISEEQRKSILSLPSPEQMVLQIYILQKRFFQQQGIPFTSPALEYYEELADIYGETE